MSDGAVTQTDKLNRAQLVPWFTCLIVVPLALGGGLYLVKDGLLRQMAPGDRENLESVLLFQLADGFWAFSLTAAIGAIWIRARTSILIGTLTGSLSGGPLWEVYQYFAYDSTSYDVFDCVAYVVFGSISLVVVLMLRRRLV